VLELADTHCHLNFDAFEADREEVVARARTAGVNRLLNPGIDLNSSHAALNLARRFDPVYAAVGIHPNSAGQWSQASGAELSGMAVQDKAVAIGEIGLDYYRLGAPRDQQLAAFQAQLELAAKVNRPVVIHNRDATGDVLELLSAWHADLVESGSALAQRPGVLHSFSGSQAQAAEAIRMGFLIGITGPVTFRNAPELQDLVAALSLESLLVETDAPFLTPHPLRGRRNEPANVGLVVEKIADLHQRSAEEVARRTSSNAAQLFGW
jgi:TatD DNase family protein